MSNRGGARPGSGRKKKLVANLNPVARDLAIAQIQEMTPEIIGKLAELARGVTVQNENLTASGSPVYTKPPDRAAIELLLAYGIGKPADKIEMTSESTVRSVSDTSEEERAERLAKLLAVAKSRSSQSHDSYECENGDSEAEVLRLRLAE